MGVTSILSLLSGVALFLYGMSVMGDSLKKVAGNKLELILYKLTSTPLKGILLGTAVTAIIQSSSATTVMVVGFVNSGMMKVAQSIGIIMGANIGTSVTGWILCLSYIEGSGGIAQLLSTATISAVVAIIGIIFRMVMKKDSYRHVGEIMLGFAILMFGMQTMSGAVAPLKDSETFRSMLTMFTNPAAGILVGILFTAVLQSASASVGILQALSVTGGISFAVALPIVMGIGVGAACPVLMSAIGTNKNGKRTALIYLLNDLFGMLFWSIVFYTLNAIFHFKFMNVVMTPVYIALMNTVFRAATICILSPFIKYIEKLVYILIKDDEEDLDEQKDFDLLEERFLNYPAIAIAQSHTAMNGMARKARKNLSRSVSLLKKYSDEKYQKIEEKEVLIDKYEDKLGTYLMQLTGKELSGDQTKQVSKFLHTISDFERMGDHALNVARTAKELYDKKIVFSDEARYELNVLIAAMKEIVTSTVQAFSRDDLQMAARIEPLRELIGMLCDELKMRHVDRLQSGKCGISQGFAFNDLLTNIERVSDHCSNVAVAMIELESRNFDTHEYLKSVREMRNTEYKRYFEEYEQKYSIDDFEAWSERQQEKEKMKALLEEQQLQQGRKSKNVETAETIIPENIDPLEDPLEDTEEN
ncbi:MAG: Na/Pi cotransporter family protein [Lachnospiraceae bacterium]